MIGNSPYFFATSSSDWDFSRCCHSGVRLPGRARGISSARAAFSRKRAPNSALADELGDDGVLDLVGLEHDQLRARRLLGVGQVDDDPVVGPDRVGLEPELVADPRAQREPPRGVDAPAERATARTAASRRSRPGTARRRSRGRTGRPAWPPAARAGTRAGWSRHARRGRTSRSSTSAGCSTAQRENAPIASPSSFGRPTPSPFQNGTAPGSPGAGVTITRSRPISSIRHVLAPSRNVWPGRAS